MIITPTKKWLAPKKPNNARMARMSAGRVQVASLGSVLVKIYRSPTSIFLIIQLNTEYEKPYPAFADQIFSTFKFIK